MKILSPQQCIEFFHLVFLQHLGRLVDKNLFILKGGCNLRFFMKNIRYSEHIDLDVRTIAPLTLQKNVQKILTSESLAKILQAQAVSITHHSSPKQIHTTQRWKITLQMLDKNLSLHTKIECSRRNIPTHFEFDGVAQEILDEYFLFPVSLNHYTVFASIIQKITALAERVIVQCRDVFDLYFLFQKQVQFDYELHKFIQPEILEQAKINTFSLSYPMYKSQVVAYLMSEYQKEYDSRQKWDEIKKLVYNTLLANIR